MLKEKKAGKCFSQIMLWPESREEAKKELEIKKNHKWLFLTLDPKLIQGIKEFMKMVFSGKVLIIDGNKEWETYMGKEELGWRRFVNATGLDGGSVQVSDMTITPKDGKEILVSFLYAGMELEEVEEHYQKFIGKRRGILKSSNKKGN